MIFLRYSCNMFIFTNLEVPLFVYIFNFALIMIQKAAKYC